MMKKNDILPVAAYTDPEWFEQEMRHIFSTTWCFAGFVEDLTQVGQYLCVQAGLNHLFVLMAPDGKLRAFHNMCRHRGARLLDGSGMVKGKLTCPYHDWSYNLDGELKSLPKLKIEFAGLDKSCLGLKPAKVSIWRGMIWLHPDVSAVDIEQWFGPIETKLGAHQPSKLVEAKAYKTVDVVQANWKIIVENYIDHYHLAQLHSGTLNMYDHARAEYGFVGPHFTFWEPLEAEYADNLEQNTSMPLIDHIPKSQLGAFAPMLFPAIGLSETESSWSVFHIIPLSVNQTRVEVRTKVMPASDWTFVKYGMRSAKFWQNRVRAKNSSFDKKHPLGSADFMQEDIYVCEQLQTAMQSPYYEAGPSAQYGESPIRQHQQLVLDYLQTHLSRTK